MFSIFVPCDWFPAQIFNLCFVKSYQCNRKLRQQFDSLDILLSVKSVCQLISLLIILFFIRFNQCRCTERDAGFAAGWSFWNSGGSSQKLQESSAQLPPPLEVFLWPTRVSDHPSGQWGHQASHWLLQVGNTLEFVMVLDLCCVSCFFF